MKGLTMIGLKIPIRTLLIVFGTALVTALVLIVGFLVWLDRVYTVDKLFVRISPYFRAIVPGKPEVSTRLYMLGGQMRFILVLRSKSSKRREEYFIDANKQEIGVPNLREYRPFWNGALVWWEAWEGFEDDTAVEADWDWIDNGKDLRIRVKGLPGKTSREVCPRDDTTRLWEGDYSTILW
jgi:hypothetical protein